MQDIWPATLNLLDNLWNIFVVFIAETWWFWLFLILFPMVRSTWFYWRQLLWDRSQKYILLEIRIPREIDKGPRVMEQVFKAFHGLTNAALNFEEKYWDGERPRTFSFEIVSRSGEVHFYVRCYHRYKPLVSAALFAYYADVEVVEVDDYVKELPVDMADVYGKGFNIWGSEMLLVKPAIFPIKTYTDFETIDEELQLDPISAFLEVISKLKKDEMVVIQMVATSAGLKPQWYEKYQDDIEKLHKTKSKSASEDSSAFPSLRTPGETQTLKMVEKNIGEPAFNVVVRFVYLSPKNIFYDSYARRGLVGSFNQYGTLDLNSFRQNFSISTLTMIWYWPYLFPKWRGELRKQRLYQFFRERTVPMSTAMGKFLSSHPLNWNTHTQTIELTVSEMATLFHPPTKTVLTAPHIKRIESRTAGPSAGLRIFGDEKALERFE